MKTSLAIIYSVGLIRGLDAKAQVPENLQPRLLSLAYYTLMVVYCDGHQM